MKDSFLFQKIAELKLAIEDLQLQVSSSSSLGTLNKSVKEPIVRVDELQKAEEVIAHQIEVPLSEQELDRSGKQDHFLQAVDIPETTKASTDKSGCCKSEDILPDSKDYLNKIINSISDPIFVKDRSHRLILVNDAECKLAGRTREELLGKTDYDFFPKEQVDVFWEKDEIVFETGKENINEEIITDAEGVIRTIVTKKTLYTDHEGNKFIVGIIRDITERKQTEEALRETRNYLESLLNYSNAPIIVWDPSFKITRFNHTFEHLTRQKADDVVGQKLDILFPKESRKESFVKIERTLSGEYWDWVEIPIVRKDGEIRTVLWNSANIYAKDGQKLIATIAQGTDITDRKKVEEDLKKAKEVAEEAVRSKSEFLAIMSHEIRTPLNAVIGIAGLLSYSNLTREQQDHVKTIRQSGDALLAIINDILDFSKIDANKVELEAQPFSLHDCIKSSVDMMAVRADQKGLKISFFIDESAPKAIIGDVARVRQILVNLITNAVKFTDRGEVAIFVESKPKEKGDLREVHFSIKDTGIGISKENISRLFQPFSQVDTSIARKYGGTGLGLAISKRLAEMMGGKIWVESEPGIGSNFHFTILAPASPLFEIKEHVIQLPIELVKEGQTFSILLAEDNVVNRKVAMGMLKKLGYQADVVANGLEVLQSLELRHYDVVLMDVQMPQMDGIEATQAIRKRLPTGDQPYIIALTAYAMNGDRERCMDAGMDDYIAKPMRMDELKAALERVNRLPLSNGT